MLLAVELQSPRFQECSKSPRAQEARPKTEQWCADAADRSRIHGAEESYILDSLSRQLFSQQAHGLAAFRRAARSLLTSPLIGLYFGALRIVCFGSSTILRTPLGAISRNPVSAPSASTSPRKTGAFPAVVAYTGTAVT